MNKHQIYDFPDTPAGVSPSRAMVIEAVIEGLQRVARGEHSPEQQRLILRNAAMLLSDLGLENSHELG